MASVTAQIVPNSPPSVITLFRLSFSFILVPSKKCESNKRGGVQPAFQDDHRHVTEWQCRQTLEGQVVSGLIDEAAPSDCRPQTLTYACLRLQIQRVGGT